jgi:hypothetical protein
MKHDDWTAADKEQILCAPRISYFSTGTRILISDTTHEHYGKFGTVRRPRIGDTGAWVEIDGVDSPRLLFPDQCISSKSAPEIHK